MAIVNQVQKKIRMNQWDIVKFQLNVHCHINKIIISDLDLNCLTLLAMSGEMILGDFCQKVVDNNITASYQSVRNIIAKAENKQLLVKIGKNKKKISLSVQNI